MDYSDREAYNPRRPMLGNFNIGLGIGIEETEDGRGHIFICEDVISPNYDGPALREFMERIAVAWLKKVAPERLRECGDAAYQKAARR